MSKVLFFGYPFHGHTNPTLGLIKELVDRGEEIIYYSEEPFRARIENTGARFRSYQTQGFQGKKDVDLSVSDGVEEWLSSFTFIIGYGQAVIQNMLPEIKAEAAQYIIHDSCAYWGKKVAAMLHLPGVSSITTLVCDQKMMETEADLFLHSVLRVSAENLFKKYGARNVATMLDNMAFYLKTLFGKEFDILDLILPREGLNIVYTSRLFQMSQEYFDNSFQFIGPSIMRNEKNEGFPFGELTGNPLVYISLGTIFNQKSDFFKKCLTAFQNTDFQVVMAVGNKIDIQELGTIPPNFIVRNYLPQLEILQQASVFISHAGMNSTSEGIYYHVPLILFPQGNDQFLVAERVEQLGVGVYVRNANLSPHELRKLTEKVLNDQRFKEKGKLVAESFREAGSYRKAADAIFAYKTRSGTAQTKGEMQ